MRNEEGGQRTSGACDPQSYALNTRAFPCAFRRRGVARQRTARMPRHQEKNKERRICVAVSCKDKEQTNYLTIDSYPDNQKRF